MNGPEFERLVHDELMRRHGKKRLANDNPLGLPGLVTSKEVKADIDRMIDKHWPASPGQCPLSPEEFREALAVERDAGDPSKLHVMLPLDMIAAIKGWTDGR